MLKRPLLALSLMLPLAACGPSEEEAAEIDQEAEAAAAEMADELEEMLGDEPFGGSLADELDEPLDPAAEGALPQGVEDEEAVEAATGTPLPTPTEAP